MALMRLGPIPAIIKLINSVASVVNTDPDVADRIKIVFLPDYNGQTDGAPAPASDLLPGTHRRDRDAAAVTVLYLLRDPPWLKSLGDLVTAAIGLAIALLIWQMWLTSDSFPSASGIVTQYYPSAARYSGPKGFGPSAGRTGPAAAAWPVPKRWTDAVTDHIVVGDRVLLDASFGAARARLEILASDGMLLSASEVAYGEGITGLVKLAGPAAGLTRLAGVRLDDLAQTYNCAHIPLQWEAIAADGTLFTALDADLMLVPAGDQITALALAGAYRPQPGRVGAKLDRAIVRRCAAAAIGSFVTRVAGALVHPAGTGMARRP